MLGKICTLIGFVVLAIATTGVLGGGKDVIDGTGSLEDIPASVSDQFAEVGFAVPSGSGQHTSPQPYTSVPQGTDLPGQLRQPQEGSLFTPSR